MVVLSGLPGAGKSTLAQALSRRLPQLGSGEVRVLDKDRVRDALFGPCDHARAEGELSFEAILAAAGYHLDRGRVVIFDGLTFSRASQVARARRVAGGAGGWSSVIRCEIAIERQGRPRRS